MSDLPTPDTSNYDGTFDNEPTYWQLADPLINDQSVQKWVLPVPDGILQARDELIDSRLQAITDAWWGMTEEQQVAIGAICEGYEDDAALDVLLDTLKRDALTEENSGE